MGRYSSGGLLRGDQLTDWIESLRIVVKARASGRVYGLRDIGGVIRRIEWRVDAGIVLSIK